MNAPRPTAVAVTLAKDLARSIRGGHPWIYRDALTPDRPLPDGTSVEVRTRDGRPLARGFWDAKSPIAVRVLQAGPAATWHSDPQALVAERLRAALERRLARLDRAQTNAFRWVHGEGDELPGIHVDLYDDVAVVRYDGDGARAFYRKLGMLLTDGALPARARLVVDRETRGAAGALTVRENGHLFDVDLAHGQKGGLFLDQRENRQEIAKRAAGKSVLNLFGYTGGFSVYAAKAGARSTHTVDLAKPAIEAARRNFEANALSSANAHFHAGDAFAFLTDAARRGETWDIVISDPPSFAPSKRALPAARRAYRQLHELAAAVTKPGGLLCPASCSSHFDRREFLASVEEGARAAGLRWTMDSLRGAGFDHPVRESFPEGDYLKFAIGRLALR